MPTLPDWLSRLLQDEVHRRIDEDPRTVPGTFLGWRKKLIFQQVLEIGQANFDQPIGQLTPDDRAVLYARYNQGRHLDELIHAFTLLVDKGVSIGRPTVIDLGCGPFTAGLALAAVFGQERSFRYYGVDRALSMCRLGRRLADAARDRQGLNCDTSCWFGTDLDSAPFGYPSGELTIVVASYLLASPNLIVGKLLPQLLAAITRAGPGPAVILYTNSAAPRLNEKYPQLRNGLLAAGFQIEAEDVEPFLQTRQPKPLRYALFYRSAVTRIPVRRSTR